MFIEAGQPEILRAAQRDDTFKKYLSQSISGIVQSLFGIPFWIKYKELTERLSNVLYQCVTTMSNLQTLGEEYTGMIQINRSVQALPKKHHQLLMILLNNFGDKVWIYALEKFGKLHQQLLFTNTWTFPYVPLLCGILIMFEIFLPFYLKFHKALFFFNGHYYELSKRLCGIKYVLVRHWLKDRSSLPAFKLLGIITLIQFILDNNSIISKTPNTNEEKLQQTDVKIGKKCPLCLNIMQMCSVTPCGHLFCWPCIFDWLKEQQKCPLCRQVFQPSRVVYLQNYS